MDRPLATVAVLLTDAEQRSTLAAARSLVRAGCAVHVVGRKRWTLAGVARGVRAWRIIADPTQDRHAYAAEIASLVRALAVEVLIPMTDASVEAVLEHRGLFPDGCTIPLPSASVCRTAADKAEILALAQKAGLAGPHSVLIEKYVPGDLPSDLPIPGVVKPHRSVVRGNGAVLWKCPVTFVEERAECEAVLSALPPQAYPVLVQSRIRGDGEGIFLLRWGGRIVARFAHRRLREKPPAGGVSVYRESIPPDPEFLAAATRLLEELDWEGVAMIEGKRDAVSGRPMLMEINGRLWGSLQLAIDAGVDFPVLLVACAVGAAVPTEPPSYRVGIRSRWLWGDLDHLLIRMARSPRTLHLDGHAPSRWRACLDFLTWDRGRDRLEIWSHRDPAPFVFETLRRLLPGG